MEVTAGTFKDMIAHEAYASDPVVLGHRPCHHDLTFRFSYQTSSVRLFDTISHFGTHLTDTMIHPLCSPSPMEFHDLTFNGSAVPVPK